MQLEKQPNLEQRVRPQLVKTFFQRMFQNFVIMSRENQVRAAMRSHRLKKPENFTNRKLPPVWLPLMNVLTCLQNGELQRIVYDLQLREIRKTEQDANAPDSQVGAVVRLIDEVRRSIGAVNETMEAELKSRVAADVKTQFRMCVAWLVPVFTASTADIAAVSNRL